MVVECSYVTDFPCKSLQCAHKIPKIESVRTCFFMYVLYIPCMYHMSVFVCCVAWTWLLLSEYICFMCAYVLILCEIWVPSIILRLVYMCVCERYVCIVCLLNVLILCVCLYYLLYVCIAHMYCVFTKCLLYFICRRLVCTHVCSTCTIWILNMCVCLLYVCMCLLFALTLHVCNVY